MKDETIKCAACDAGLELVWYVQGKKTMHLTHGLGVTSCARVDALDQRARDAKKAKADE
jgi:hypothetical protein